ncbi:hypothetical protein ACU8KH_04608 [Lachancea thermotolerans]
MSQGLQSLESLFSYRSLANFQMLATYLCLTSSYIGLFDSLAAPQKLKLLYKRNYVPCEEGALIALFFRVLNSSQLCDIQNKITSLPLVLTLVFYRTLTSPSLSYLEEQTIGERALT